MMKIYHPFTFPFYKLIFITSLLAILVSADKPAIGANNQQAASTITSGYSVLKLFLEDEQYLTTVRRAKMLITFEDISDRSSKLIDKISNSSEQALEDLEKLAAAKPVIVFEEFPDELIGMATFDSLRTTTAKELLFEPADFEKNLLLSQFKILRVISHLAKQLEEKETNSKRKAWLNKLAELYENYYQQINARISISAKAKG